MDLGQFAVLIPIVIALTEAVKRIVKDIKTKKAGELEVKLTGGFSILVSLILGVLLAFGIAETYTVHVAISGLLVGLSASGLYSGGKSVIKG